MPQLTVDNPATLAKLVAEVPLALVYFGAPTCGICTAVKPKLEALCEERFPKLLVLAVDRDAAPDVPAAWQVFSLPTVVLTAEGREARRFVRTFAIEAVAEAIERPYGMVYG